MWEVGRCCGGGGGGWREGKVRRDAIEVRLGDSTRARLRRVERRSNTILVGSRGLDMREHGIPQRNFVFIPLFPSQYQLNAQESSNSCYKTIHTRWRLFSPLPACPLHANTQMPSPRIDDL